ncbi:U5 small nuclear ribonucleoprotein component, partial [Tetrabaena socialis]
MADDLYDEFGNYVGPALDDSEEEDDERQQQHDFADEEEEEGGRLHDADAMQEDDEPGDGGMAVVLHEDKKYYPSAEETYGPEVETLVMEEDAQALEVPIVAPVKVKKFETLEAEPLRTHYSNEFLATLMANPELVRNVAVVGHLHHGKTTLMDMFIET